MAQTDRLFIEDSRRPSATLRRADTFMRRLKGLLGQAGLQAEEGLWIVPCTSVHTFFMRFPIDVAFVDREGRIVKVVEHMGAGRLAFARGAKSVIELAAGSARRMGLATGQRLERSCAVDDDRARRPLTAASLRNRGGSRD